MPSREDDKEEESDPEAASAAAAAAPEAPTPSPLLPTLPPADVTAHPRCSHPFRHPAWKRWPQAVVVTTRGGVIPSVVCCPSSPWRASRQIGQVSSAATAASEAEEEKVDDEQQRWREREIDDADEDDDGEELPQQQNRSRHAWRYRR